MGQLLDRFRSRPDEPKAADATPKFNPALETETDYHRRWFSIRIIYFTMFLMSFGFSIILSSVWPYLDKLDPTAGKIFMGYIVASNPFAQMLFSPLFGWWGNKSSSIRAPMLAALLVFTVASAIYSCLEVFPSHYKEWMLFSRFMIGVASSNVAVCRSYLSAATTVDERTGAVSMISLAQILGFILGPAVQAIVTPLGDAGVPIFNTNLPLNMYTGTGWINVVMAMVNFALFLPCFFKEHKIAAREAMILQGKTSEKETWKAIKPDLISAWTLIGAFFVLVFNFVLLETLGTPLVMEQFAMDKERALYFIAVLMAVGAVVACISFVLIKPLCSYFEENSVLIWIGFSLMVLGRFACIPIGDEPPLIYDPHLPPANGTTEHVGCPSTQEWCATTNAMTKSQFLVGYALTSVGYPIGVTLIQTLFSKILGPRPQGVWMGLMTASGCFSRVLGPVFVSNVYTVYGTIWVFGLTGAMMVLCMLWLYLVRNRLVPPDLKQVEENAQMLTES